MQRILRHAFVATMRAAGPEKSYVTTMICGKAVRDHVNATHKWHMWFEARRSHEDATLLALMVAGPEKHVRGAAAETGTHPQP